MNDREERSASFLPGLKTATRRFDAAAPPTDSPEAELGVVVPDPLHDRADSRRLRGARLDASQRAELIESACKRLEERLAVLAACEVAAYPTPRARAEIVVDVVGQARAGLATGRHPGLHEQVQHVHLDAEGGRFVSGSYDPRMAAGEETDAELVRLAQEGDLDAFAEIVRRHERRLRFVLLRILDDARDVEEAVQDVFVQAWRNLDRYRAEAALFTWLYRIGVNAALARTRRKQHPLIDLDSLQGEHAAQVPRDLAPEQAAETSELRSRIVAALAELSFEYREAVVLRDVAGLSNEGVAQALEISLPAAKSRIHRGRLQLRELLEPPDGH